MALKTPQVIKTPMQTVVKMRLRHTEFGIMAGRPSFSCRPTQKMKVGISAREIKRVARGTGLRIAVELSLIKLVQ